MPLIKRTYYYLGLMKNSGISYILPLKNEDLNPLSKPPFLLL
jgi:hypothetical protein